MKSLMLVKLFRRSRIFLLLTTIGAIYIVAFNNCSRTYEVQGLDVSAIKKSADTNSPTPSGIPPLNSTKTCDLNNIRNSFKVLFIVDRSTSNHTTDDDMSFRYNSMKTFFNKYESKSNFKWGLETFAGSSATSIIGNGSSADAFGDAANMDMALKSFHSSKDGGSTPYEAALELAQTIIRSDLQESTASGIGLNDHYAVVFISDGAPSHSSSGSLPESLRQSVMNKVKNIVTLSPGRITLSGVHYNTQSDSEGTDTLRQMASKNIGNGQFVDVFTNKASMVSIDDLLSSIHDNCAE